VKKAFSRLNLNPDGMEMLTFSISF